MVGDGILLGDFAVQPRELEEDGKEFIAKHVLDITQVGAQQGFVTFLTKCGS